MRWLGYNQQYLHVCLFVYDEIISYDIITFERFRNEKNKLFMDASSVLSVIQDIKYTKFGVEMDRYKIKMADEKSFSTFEF